MDKDLDYSLGVSETELEVIFGLERRVGIYGLKSKVFLGFTPALRQLYSHIGRNEHREFYLKLELCCPSDFRNWLAEAKYHSSVFGSGGPKDHYRYYFMRTPSELREFIKECPFAKKCEDSEIETVLGEIEIKAFWSKVIRKGL